MGRPMLRNIFAVITHERTYPWCTVNGTNPNHSDTRRLHTLLFGSLGNLAFVTDVIHKKWREAKKATKAKVAAEKVAAKKAAAEKAAKARIAVKKAAAEKKAARKAAKAAKVAAEKADSKKQSHSCGALSNIRM